MGVASANSPAPRARRTAGRGGAREPGRKGGERAGWVCSCPRVRPWRVGGGAPCPRMGEAGPGGGSRVRLEGRGSHLRAAAPAGCSPRPERAGCAGPQAAHTQRGRAWELAESAPGVCDEESDLRATAVARARPGY